MVMPRSLVNETRLSEETTVRNSSPLAPVWIVAPAWPDAAASTSDAANALSLSFSFMYFSFQNEPAPGRSLQVPSLGSQDDNNSSASPRGNGWLELRGLAAQLRSNTENAQRQRLAHSLRAVLDIQLAQNFLHMILHRQRADHQNGPDLDVALAHVNPPQDFLLSSGKKPGPRRTCTGAFSRPVDLGAHPRQMQERHDHLGKISLPRADGPRLTGEGEEACELTEHIVGSVRENDVRSYPAQLARKRASGQSAPVSRFADHGLEVIVLPGFDEVRHH